METQRHSGGNKARLNHSGSQKSQEYHCISANIVLPT